MRKLIDKAIDAVLAGNKDAAMSALHDMASELDFAPLPEIGSYKGVVPWEVIYKNYRGKVAKRRLVPIRVWRGRNEWHPEEQWLMHAFDLDKNEVRNFALDGFAEGAIAMGWQAAAAAAKGEL